MVKNKKAQGMPINVVVAAVLALIILLAIISIFGNRIKIFSESLQSCSAKQGDCYNAQVCASNKALISNTDCEKQGKICCITAFETNDAIR